MSASIGSENRNVLPNWRSTDRAQTFGEFAAVGEYLREVDVDIAEPLASFRSYPGYFSALDYLGSAFLFGIEDASTREARALVEGTYAFKSREPLTELEGRAPMQQSAAKKLDSAGNKASARASIARLRARLNQDPRDSLALVDLSLLYTNLGQERPAIDAMNRAIMLAPEQRHVLRSASRLFIHFDQPDRAAELLGRSSALSDPWVMATYVATSDEVRKPFGHAREIRTMLSDNKWSPHARSELAGQFATEEMRAGHSRIGAAYFSQSLVDPNDNALAQATWARKIGATLSEEQEARIPEVPMTFEASARRLAQSWDWEESLAASLSWTTDQSFSATPPAFAGWVSAISGIGYAQAADALFQGLSANPGDRTLLNNLAFALAHLGDVEGANGLMDSIPGGGVPLELAIETATRGLIAYRRGDVNLGRELYATAVREIELIDAPAHTFAATSYWALEEIRALNGDRPRQLAEELVASVNRLAPAFSETELGYLARRVAQDWATRSS